VVVAGEDRETGAVLEVPKAEGLIVGRRQDPGILRGIGMELDGSDVIQMAQEGEEASSELLSV